MLGDLHVLMLFLVMAEFFQSCPQCFRYWVVYMNVALVKRVTRNQVIINGW